MDEDHLDRLRHIAADLAVAQQGPRIGQGREGAGERGARLVRREVVDIEREYLGNAS
jgi:hypothetical protein